ncbi:MAG: FAD-dependent thymidylate synthase [Bryobacterales bacterium]
MSAAPRVVVVGPMPPEKSAYALARYSRSADSVVESLEWVRSHSSEKFLDSFYFQYGHASIADLGHVTFCFEGVPRSSPRSRSRTKPCGRPSQVEPLSGFSQGSIITPAEIAGTADGELYQKTCGGFIQRYLDLHGHLRRRADGSSAASRGDAPKRL